MRFRLSCDPLSGPLIEPSTSTGAVVTFVGQVRGTNDGKSVASLEYEAFDELALSEGESILDEAMIRFPILDAVCTHRVGRLRLGEVAIRVEVATAHREEAFEACRWIVDEVKSRVPIWKKEHYLDGGGEWLNPLQGH